MDHDAVPAHPIGQVLGHLGRPRPPRRLAARRHRHPPRPRSGRVHPAAVDLAQAAAGELIGNEPPWQLAYRLRAGPDTHVLRITCTTAGTGTRVHIRQASPAQPLAVDLTRLSHR